MRVFPSLEAIPAGAFEAGTVAAIGKFDGVHLGHQTLLHRIVESAGGRGLEPVVFTFANNPLSFLRPEASPPPIMSVRQRLDAFETAGVSSCVVVPFDAELAALSAEGFVDGVLVGMLHVRHICVGADFRFGHLEAGDSRLLAQMGERSSFTMEAIDSVEIEGVGRVSSSRAREAVLQGDVALAARMLGRPHALRSSVAHGDARGRELGFPTANLAAEIEGLRPADGVYAGWAVVGGQRHEAAISVGANVTFEPEGQPRVEAHLIDFEGDIYGEPIEILFAERLRGMVAFNGVEALVARMREDVRETRTILLGR